ncbi:MAG: ornithine carbamoyltransferase [Gammaproteobacteria bacterium]
MKKARHFLTLLDLTAGELDRLIVRGCELKKLHAENEIYEPLKNKVLGMVFEKSSTRTRVSFETGMIQFGGDAIFLSPRDTQLGRGEPIEDSAKVLSRMVDIIMIRTYAHQSLVTFSDNANVPVINGLSDMYHPCQLLADMQTYYEHRGDIRAKTVTWIGDGNNMCHSYVNAARQYGFHLNIASPAGFEPDDAVINNNSDIVSLSRNPLEAADGADLIVTDVWASMGQEDESTERARAFQAFQVDKKVMAAADKNALFMHCLPAHRGEEVSADVIDGPQSVVWDEAENRLHAQKALLEHLLKPNQTV